MCVHHTKNYWCGLLRLEFEARGGVSGWIEKSGSDEGGNRPAQEGQQKHLSKEMHSTRNGFIGRYRLQYKRRLYCLAIAPCKK